LIWYWQSTVTRNIKKLCSLKKIFKYLFRITLTIIALVLFYLLSAFCLSRITINKELNSSSDVAIYIKTNGVHTDLVVPVKNKQIDWSSQVKFSNTLLKDTTMQLLALGWGDPHLGRLEI